MANELVNASLVVGLASGLAVLVGSMMLSVSGVARPADSTSAEVDQKISVTIKVADLPDGLYRYTYTLPNHDSRSLYPDTFDVRGVHGATPKHWEGPKGWEGIAATIEGQPETLVRWTPEKKCEDLLPPGKSLTFSFVSAVWPVMQRYNVEWKAVGEDGVWNEANGAILGRPGAAGDAESAQGLKHP